LQSPGNRKSSASSATSSGFFRARETRLPSPSCGWYSSRSRAKAAWARRIRKVYEADPLERPKCRIVKSGPMRVIAPNEDHQRPAGGLVFLSLLAQRVTTHHDVGSRHVSPSGWARLNAGRFSTSGATILIAELRNFQGVRGSRIQISGASMALAASHLSASPNPRAGTAADDTCAPVGARVFAGRGRPWPSRSLTRAEQGPRARSGRRSFPIAIPESVA